MKKKLCCYVNTWVTCTVCNKKWCYTHWVNKGGVTAHYKDVGKDLPEFGWCGKQKVGWKELRHGGPPGLHKGPPGFLIPCRDWGHWKVAI